jgi:hypothetical protein
MDIVINSRKDTVQLSQSLYINEKIIPMMGDLGISMKHEKIPLSNTVNLRTQEKNFKNKSLLPITGVLRYLADRTRPDILTAVGEISTGGNEFPSDEHVKSANRCLNFLLSTKDLKLTIRASPLDLFGYCDASHISVGNSKSRLGGCLFLNRSSGAFFSFSKNDTTVSHSSTEAEIKALDELIKQIQMTRDMLDFLGFPVLNPTKVYMDNRSAITLCETLKTSSKTKHINVRINYIREVINQRVIELHFVSTDENVADILTKGLPYPVFVRHQQILLNGFDNDYKFESLFFMTEV